jgi:hypothetical protein
MANMQSSTTGVGEHVKYICFWLALIQFRKVWRSECLVPKPIFLPSGLQLSEGVGIRNWQAG